MNKQTTHIRVLLATSLMGLALACTDQNLSALNEGKLKPAPASMDIVSGQDQSGEVGTQLSSPLEVRVLDSNGEPIKGQIVNFRVTSGGGSVYAGTTLTNGSGIAQERWTLGPEPGVNTLEARAVDSTTGDKLVFASFSANGVSELPTVSSVFVSPDSVHFAAKGDTARLQAAAQDQFGDPIATSFTWSSMDAAVATVNSSGLVTAQGAGTTSIVAAADGTTGAAKVVVKLQSVSTPPDYGATEPRPSSSSTVVFKDDFESYKGDCISMVLYGGGPWSTNSGDHCSYDPNGIISSPLVTGRDGTMTRVARWDWPEDSSSQHFILGKTKLSFPGHGRAEQFTFWYRAPDFVYATGENGRVGKKMFLVHPDDSGGRLTFNESAWSLLQSNGVKIDAPFDRWPGGATSDEEYARILTDGNWHRFTLQRVPESSTGAMDGAFRVWFDGELVVERKNLGTFAGGVHQVDLFGYFNGGSSKRQQEYVDDLVVWHN